MASDGSLASTRRVLSEPAPDPRFVPGILLTKLALQVALLAFEHAKRYDDEDEREQQCDPESFARARRKMIRVTK